MEVEVFIGKWLGVKGGAERANYAQFINDFCRALKLTEPGVADGGVLGSYQFEGPVPGGGLGGSTGAIDLYKQGCFILEAKQSKLPDAGRSRPELFDAPDSAPASPSGARYDKLMRDALAQAKRYAVNLPADHPWPPFLIVCDVGRAFELYFDWSGNGRGYGHFPDQHSYRFDLQRFADADVQELFAAIWTDPAKVDPRARAAEVSRGIARQLADVSMWLEGLQRQRSAGATDSERSLAIEETALFLMRIVFCMFAEDVGLLPNGSFTAFLEKAVSNEAAFEPELHQLWKVMGSSGGDRYASAIGGEVRYFNGGLFRGARTFALSQADREKLLEAARADWTKVEPAIFGTLLEQTLTPTERAKLGAHYTPRPYVERLVQATIMEVLEAEWEVILHPQEGEPGLSAVQAFHERLCALRILDPACGTANFLYVAMENLMRLEGDVIETIRQLGGTAEPRVGPQQFHGLELNPRAAVIAELVLWIGWLRWRMANDPAATPSPVLMRFDNINFGGHAGYDAVLRHKPTGEVDADNPTIPDWPEADFIVGNPPFIGGKDLRRNLGGDYAEVLWAANRRVPPSADFVMQWWDRAAHTLVAPASPLIRFGFVTTNSITQRFSRRVIENYLADGQLSLLLAIPDHPWIKPPKVAGRIRGDARKKDRKKNTGTAAVRIAMTVATRGVADGRLVEIIGEAGLDTDQPVLDQRVSTGRINPDLSLGSDVTTVHFLKANDGLASPGVKLHGAGFIVTKNQAERLGLGKREGLDHHIRPYRNGRDLLQRSRDVLVIDLFGLDEKEVRGRFPEVYQHLLATVKLRRDEQASISATKDALSYASTWWLHGKPRPDLRAAMAGLNRYIVTPETSKHRVFQFMDSSIVPDNANWAICTDDASHLGILQSTNSLVWILKMGGTLEDRPKFTKTDCFDPFPFPDPTPEQRAAIAELAEELDATRKTALGEVPGLTMTELYNLRDKLRRGDPLDAAEQERARNARAGIVDRLHRQLDVAVAQAYGWPADLSPGEIVARLVALNAERAAEEQAGHVRWLRPDYQLPRFGASAG